MGFGTLSGAVRESAFTDFFSSTQLSVQGTFFCCVLLTALDVDVSLAAFVWHTFFDYFFRRAFFCAVLLAAFFWCTWCSCILLAALETGTSALTLAPGWRCRSFAAFGLLSLAVALRLRCFTFFFFTSSFGFSSTMPSSSLFAAAEAKMSLAFLEVSF